MDFQKCSPFLELPIEVRAMILEYLLPYESSKECGVHAYGGTVAGFPDHFVDRSCHTFQTPLGDRPSHQILTVNRQIHDEACAILKRNEPVKLPHCIEINEQSFWSPLDCHDEMAEAAMRASFNYNMDFLFPGIDLSTVKEFHITIKPVDFPGFWNRFFPTLTTLCEDRLRRNTPLKRLSVFFEDMRKTWAWADAADHWTHIYQYGEPVEASFELYESALQPLRILASHVNSCHVNLPYWMEFAQGMSELSRVLLDELNAHISFTPIVAWRYSPEDCEDGVPVRSWLLARLAREEYNRTQEGMRNRLAATGYWA